MNLSYLLLGTYVLTKALAYAGWCRLGLRWLAPERSSPASMALGLGLLRLLLGLGFGVGIFLASSALFERLHESGVLDPTVSALLAYVATYVPVRWIEWALIELLLHRPSRNAAGFLLGPDSRARAWRLGGIVVSCLADAPLMLAAGGLPVGRFMC